MKKLILFIAFPFLVIAAFCQNTGTATLTGKHTVAFDAKVASIKWTKLSGPVEGNITNPNTDTTTVTGLVAGIYIFQYEVVDNFGMIGRDQVTVTVKRNPKAPVADAGKDFEVQL